MNHYILSDVALKQKITVLFISISCLLVQQLPLKKIPQYIKSAIIQKQQTIKTKAIKLQYTSANHVLGFGSSQVVVAGRTHALTMTLSGAKKVHPIIQDKRHDSQPEKLTALETQPFTTTIKYTHPWPKVTALFRPSPNGIVESDYHIEPGFNKQTIKKIRIHYNRPIELDKNGGLSIKYATGIMKESRPIAWQEINGQRNFVQVKYKKLGEQEIGFQVKGYDSNYTLIIDPTLSWNTFLGGTGADYGNAIALDGSGNVVIGGRSDATWGSPIRGYTSGIDCYVAKLDSTGNLLWHTFLGGTGSDQGHGIVIDGSGNVVVGGQSDATWGSPIRGYSSGLDGFAAKLDSGGNLLWHTFLGGAGVDEGKAIAVDGSGNVVLGGDSDAAWGSPVRGYSGSYDGYAAKLDSAGNLLWNTFVGGGGFDLGEAIAVDGSGNVVVAGLGANWGSPIRGYSGATDGYAAKVDSGGNLVWNTFLGGAGVDYGFTIAVDGSNNVVVGGVSNATWGSPIRGYSSGSDAYAAKLNSGGNLLWHTFLGGAGTDFGRAIAAGDSGNVVVGGYSYATWGSPIQGYNGGFSDGYAAKLDSGGNLIWNTFLGGTGGDEEYAIAVDGSGNVVVGGHSDATWGSPIIVFSGGRDAYIAKITEDTPTATATPVLSITPTLTITPTVSATPTPTRDVQLSLINNLIIYPNPFRTPSQNVTIQYVLSEDADVTITMYSYLGAKIKTIKCYASEPGGQGNAQGINNQVIWDGRNATGQLQATGGYICQLVAKSADGKKQEKATAKIGLIR